MIAITVAFAIVGPVAIAIPVAITSQNRRRLVLNYLSKLKNTT
jgi:hypothetical protein